MADEIISLSRIESYLVCPHAYYLDEKKKQEGLPITGFDAKSDWLKQSFRNLVSKAADKTPIKGLKGARLAAVLKYQYRSAETFGNEKQGEWLRRFSDEREKFHGRDIVWLYNPQWWIEGQNINKACHAYYSHLLKEGLPLDDLTEKDVEFYFGGRKWNVRPGVVRYGGIVEEIRTTDITKSKVNKDWTIAPKLYAIHTLSQDPENSMKWNAETGLRYRRVSLNGGDYYEPDKIIHMYAALYVVEHAEKRIANKEFAPNYKNCETCRYNVLTADNKPACKERKPKLRIMKPMNRLI